VLSIIVESAIITNVFIFTAKIVVELSIGVNRVTNFVEAVNLTLLLFSFFAGFTLQGITLVDNFDVFSPETQ
jgi:hypothetical protein